MNFVNFYFGLKIMIPVIIILLIIGYILYSMLSFKFKERFYKNCKHCKHYKFYDTMLGNNGKYKCTMTNRIDVLDVNCRYKFVKCDKFES